jgi:hypothetical protein
VVVTVLMVVKFVFTTVELLVVMWFMGVVLKMMFVTSLTTLPVLKPV